MSDIAVKVEDLWKQYRIGHKASTSFRETIGNLFSKSELDYFWALKELNFEIKQGEAVGIIGKNGAGKSTLLKVLSKITYPTKGRVEINGRVSSLLEVGTGFHPELSGRQNVFLNGTILGMTRREINSKFDEIVAFSGVEKFIDTAVKHYSSGMKVRLAFSVAAHLEPEILIIDEVLAVGDAEFQKKCLGKMGDVAGEGRTVIFVSHNMGAVETLCERGFVINNGEIGFIGEKHRAISHYLSESQKVSDIMLRNDRKGNGSLKIIGIILKDSFDNVVGQTGTGQYLSVDFRFEAVNKIDNPIITIHIANNQDEPLMMLHSRMSGDHFKDVKGEGVFSCIIQKVPLPPGEYFISYSVLGGGSFLDALDNAVSLDVISGDFYGSGEIPSASQGKVLLDAQWKMS